MGELEVVRAGRGKGLARVDEGREMKDPLTDGCSAADQQERSHRGEP